MISYVDPDPHGSAFWKNYRIRILVAKKNENLQIRYRYMF